MRARPVRRSRLRKTQYLFAATVPALVVALSITGFVWAQKGVTVVVDGEARSLVTQASDVAGALREARVEVGVRDLVTPGLDAAISEGDTVVVRRSIPVTLETSGESIELSVIGRTVADALVSAGVDPSEHLGVSPPLGAALEPGMHIHAPKIVVRVVETAEVLAFKTVKTSDPSLPLGVSETIVEGKRGRAVRVYRTMVTDDVEGERVLVSQRVVANAVDRIVAIGSAIGSTGTRSAPARIRLVRAANRPTTGQRRMKVSATAYSPGFDSGGWKTATGVAAGLGVIAVDPRVIPLGTRLYVPGYGYGVAADTGGAIKGARIDVCFERRLEAVRWGRRNISIVILD